MSVWMPSATMRQGVLQYVDDGGNTVTLTPDQIKSMDPLDIGGTRPCWTC
jgi:hypothetical protein